VESKRLFSFDINNIFFVFCSWCKILRVEKLQQIVVIVLNGVTDENYNQLKDTEYFQGWKQLFTSVRQFRGRSFSKRFCLG
jgi:hypothetical protein